MTFFGDSDSKATSIMQVFKSLLAALIQTYDQHRMNNSKMRGYPEFDLSV